VATEKQNADPAMFRNNHSISRMSSRKRKSFTLNSKLLHELSVDMHKSTRKHTKSLHPSHIQLNTNTKNRLHTTEMKHLQNVHADMTQYVNTLRMINNNLQDRIQEIKQSTNNIHITRRKFDKLITIRNNVNNIADEMEEMNVEILYSQNEIRNYPILRKMKVLYNEYRGLYGEIQDTIKIIFEYSANHLRR
jgi:uncharacterized protein YukE